MRAPPRLWVRLAVLFVIAVVIYWAYKHTAAAKADFRALWYAVKSVGVGIWHVLTAIGRIIRDAFQATFS